MSYEQNEQDFRDIERRHDEPPDEPYPRYAKEPTFAVYPLTPEGYVVCELCDELVPENEKSEHACDPDPDA